MEKEDHSHKQQSNCLDLELLTQQYSVYKHHPQLYLLQIIQKNNPWPTMPQDQIRKFLQDIGESYNPVAYHNITHAFDVMTHFDQYLVAFGWRQKLNISQQKRVFMLIAAYAHDSGHEGLTNTYYINSKHPLTNASSSPLQHMHVANLRRLLREHNLQIPKDILQELTQMILKTDNLYHGQLINQFQALKGLNQQDWKLPKNTLVMNCILLHAADLNNAGKDILLGSKWSNKLYIEFKHQVALEQKQGLPISFAKNWNRLSEIDSTIWFLGHMGMPLFKCLSEVSAKFAEIYSRMVKNKQYWVEMRQKEIGSVNL